MAVPNPKNYRSAMEAMGVKPGTRTTIGEMMAKKKGGKC